MNHEIAIDNLRKVPKKAFKKKYHLLWDYGVDSYHVLSSRYKKEIRGFLVNTNVQAGIFRIQ